jgi:hypothetical protein
LSSSTSSCVRMDAAREQFARDRSRAAAELDHAPRAFRQLADHRRRPVRSWTAPRPRCATDSSAICQKKVKTRAGPFHGSFRPRNCQQRWMRASRSKSGGMVRG